MKKSRCSEDGARGARTVAAAQLGRVRGGASMVEYALISSAQAPVAVPVPDCWNSSD